MSKEDKHIDNLFKEKLDGRSFDGPPAEFLADLNQRLDAKPVVSKSWVWMIFLNFFIIGLFIANASMDSSTTKTAEVKPQIENKEQHSTNEESSKTHNGQNKNASENANGTQTDNSIEKENSNNTEVKSKGLETSQANQSSTQTNQVEKSQDKNNDTDSNTKGDSGIKSASDKTTGSKNSEDSNVNKSTDSNTASNTPKDAENKVANQFSKGSNNSETNNPDNEQKGNSVAGDNRTEANKNSIEPKKTTSNKEDISISGTESLYSYVSYSKIYAPQFDEVDRKITSNDFPEFPNRWNELVAEDNNKSSEKKPKKKKDSDKRMFEIQLQGGANQWSFKTLGTNDNYVNQIDDAGTPKWTPNFGLGFNVNFNNISIGTGVDYAKFKTENLFKFPEVSTYDSTYIGGYNENITYDSLGNPIDTTYTPYYDSTTVTDTTYNTTQITNEYEWIQIPIHIGYRFNLNKWAIIPRVGMNIGLGIRQSSGEYPTETYDGLQTMSPVKWNLNLHTSLEVRREFGNWHAFGKFNYQRNLTPTIDNALFERKFNGIGFSFGVGYSF